MTRRGVALAGLAALALATAGCGGSTHAAKRAISGPPPSPYRGFVISPPSAAPAFALRDQAGRLVGAQDERGHWLVVTFLYTHCPDVCPLIANTLGVTMRTLPGLRVLAVSVDPKGDTPAAVRTFLRAHRLPTGFRYLTGSRAQLAPVWARYHVASTGGPHATVSHTAFELLIDPAGRERLLYDAQIKVGDIPHDLARLAKA